MKLNLEDCMQDQYNESTLVSIVNSFTIVDKKMKIVNISEDMLSEDNLNYLMQLKKKYKYSLQYTIK